MGASVPWLYPFIMFAAIATGWFLRSRTPQPSGLSEIDRLAVALAAFCGGMIGAKLPFVLADWRSLLELRVWLENGKTILFGMVGAYVAVELVKAMLGIQVKTGDGFAVPAAGAVAVGRIGCFVAGCCHGVATTMPWGINFGDGIRRHPTQLYESLFHATMAIILARLQVGGWFRGQLLKVYLLAYLTYRFLSEFLRPEIAIYRGLTGYQWTCLALMPILGVLWARDAASFRQKPDPEPEL